MSERIRAVMRETVQIGPYDYETRPRVLDLTPETTTTDIVAWARRIQPSHVLHIELSVEPPASPPESSAHTEGG